MTKIRDHQSKRDAVKPTRKTKSEDERQERNINGDNEQSNRTLDESKTAPAPKKKSQEDFSQAAVRIVREATEKK